MIDGNGWTIPGPDKYHAQTRTAPNPADRIAGPNSPGEAVIIDWTVRYAF
jgi:hypothetical protein